MFVRPAVGGQLDTQPDFYETPDNDFQEGPISPINNNKKNVSEDIVTTSLNPAKAMENFAGQRMDTSRTDFSGSLASRAGASGYNVSYESHGSSPETAAQKLARLQHETKDLMLEIAASKKSSENSPTNLSSESVAMISQVKILQDQLHHVSLEQRLGSDISGADFGQASFIKTVLAELGKFRQQAVSSTPANTSSGSVTYEVFLRQDQAKFSQLTKIAELEQRVQQVEARVGSAALEGIAAEIGDSEVTLHSAVASLTRRVAALNSETIGDLQTKIQVVVDLAKKTALRSASNGALDLTANGTSVEKIAQLYEMGKRCDSLAATVPAVIDRLKTLRTLHEQAAEFSRTVSQLEAAQKSLLENVAMQSTTLQSVGASLTQNMATIEKNFLAMETRINALQSKLTSK